MIKEIETQQTRTEVLLEQFHGDEDEVLTYLWDAADRCDDRKTRNEIKTEYNALAKKVNERLGRNEHKIL